MRTAHRCEVLPGRRMRAGPFLCLHRGSNGNAGKRGRSRSPRGRARHRHRQTPKLRRIQLGLSQSDLARKIGPVAFQQVQKHRPRVGKPAVSDRRSTWRRHRVFLRASTTPLPASTPRSSRARSDCLDERYAIEVLECFCDMTPEQRSTSARRDAPGALLGAVLADCSAASGLFDDPVGQKPAIR